jgi:type I restriction enzyme S subunit
MYRHDRGQRQLGALAVGTTMVNLNTSTLEQLYFGFPGETEQTEIVARVCLVDGAVDGERRVHEKLTALKAGLMHDLLAGRVRVPESILAAEGRT